MTTPAHSPTSAASGTAETLTPSRYKSEIEFPPLVSVKRNTDALPLATNENDATAYPTDAPGVNVPIEDPFTSARRLNPCPLPALPTANSTTYPTPAEVLNTCSTHPRSLGFPPLKVKCCDPA